MAARTCGNRVPAEWRRQRSHTDRWSCGRSEKRCRFDGAWGNEVKCAADVGMFCFCGFAVSVQPRMKSFVDGRPLMRSQPGNGPGNSGSSAESAERWISSFLACGQVDQQVDIKHTIGRHVWKTLTCCDDLETTVHVMFLRTNYCQQTITITNLNSD